MYHEDDQDLERLRFELDQASENRAKASGCGTIVVLATMASMLFLAWLWKS